MNCRLMLSTTVFSLFVGTSSLAAPIITAPSGLNPGDEYRLAFVTSGARDAVSDIIADYNSFVQGAADAVAELASLGATWKAIASTTAVDARDNTGTNPEVSSGVPIYLLNDTKLVDDYADLWDGSIDVPFDITELGGSPGTTVWTGTSSSGHAHPCSSLGFLSSVFCDLFGSATAGFAFRAGPEWVDLRTLMLGSLNIRRLGHFYGLSAVLSVPVPEPSSILLLGMAGLGVLRRSPARISRRQRN